MESAMLGIVILTIGWVTSSICFLTQISNLKQRVEDIEDWPECHADDQIATMNAAINKFQEMQLKFDLLMDDLDKKAVKVPSKAAILFTSGIDSKEKMIAAVKNSPNVRVVIEPEAEHWVIEDK